MTTHGQARPEPDDAKRRELQRRSNRPRGGTTDGHHRRHTTPDQQRPDQQRPDHQSPEQQAPEGRRGRGRKPRERLSPPEREARIARRRAARLAQPVTIAYPDELPVSQRKDDLAAAIRDHQVVIVAGETGSGKTTQLPKICMELGRGIDGVIGHTQPRRIAARTVADRIAEETSTELGAAIGFKVRFSDQVGDGTRVKVMTDGILLAELANDRLLRQYDTIIVDEAHERSLNIDFILGVLKDLLAKRPDLKLIITSATIDPERFSTPLRRCPDHRGVRPDLPG